MRGPVASGGIGRRWRWPALVVLVVGLAAHVWYWYWPREHATAPDADVPGALLSSAKLPLRLWLAYPHQNLGALARATGDAPAWLAAAGRFADLKTPQIPAFGPFRAPPARELAIAADPEGRRFVIVARVFPTIAVIARLAGWVAGNPWLAGGAVSLSGGRAEVSWRGTLWIVASEGESVPESAASRETEDAFAILGTASPRGVLPPGTYRLRRPAGSGSASVLELVGDHPPSSSAAADLGADPPDLLLGSAGGEGNPLERGAYLLWSSASGQDLALPGLAALRAAGGRGWKLPGAGAAALLGGVRDRAVEGGLVVTALDARTGERAAALAPHLATWLDPALPNAPVLAARVELAAAARELHRLNGALAAIPLLSRRETERWRDAERVLAPFAGGGRLDVLIGRAEGGVRCRVGPP